MYWLTAAVAHSEIILRGGVNSQALPLGPGCASAVHSVLVLRSKNIFL